MKHYNFSIGHQHKAHGDLTAEEKVLLYCFVNMKLHYFESLSTFRSFRSSIQPLFESELPTRMIDLGCGPGTAALALADCLTRPNLRYIGLDIAKPMLTRAESMIQAAIDKSLLGVNSGMRFFTNWSSLQRSVSTIDVPIHVLFNATYLFASESLDVAEVCKAVLAYKRSAKVHRILFTYANTTADIAGTKYRDFKKCMKGEIVWNTGETTRKISYYKKRRSVETSTATFFVNELIRFK